MFSSENLLLHDYINTLELKSYAVRWYLKDAILTDRAFYLYKKGSNYVTDSHRKCKLFHIDPIHNLISIVFTRTNYHQALESSFS